MGEMELLRVLAESAKWLRELREKKVRRKLDEAKPNPLNLNDYL